MENKTRTSGRTRGSSRVFGAFQDNESILRRFLRRFVSSRHDVDDICQEVVLRALEAEKAKQIQEPRAFLFGVARNVVRKGLDKKSRSLVDFVDDVAPYECVDDMPTPEDQLDAQQRMLIFGQAVATLPSQCQKVFLMKKVYGYSHKEIAKKLDISVSTVEKHASAGLRRCSDYMARHSAEEKGFADQKQAADMLSDHEYSGGTDR